MWKNVERCGAQMIIWRLRIACCIPKAKNAHLICVILIAFPLNRWLHERVSMLRYTYIACLVITVSFEDALIKFCDADI
jgi:hypothetical protein